MQLLAFIVSTVMNETMSSKFFVTIQNPTDQR